MTSPFTRVVSDPLYSPSATPGRLYHCEITIDTAAGRVTWQLDGKTVHEQLVAELPASLKIGMGVFTVHRVTDGAGTSLRGQGLIACRRDLRVRQAEPLSPPTRAEIWKKISMFGLNNLRYR
ncbi:DUF6081 family protein [Streptomyces flaveolus]|uniref:DUF6081 family protein n=1 Tax=Streptomyces flaveolus TaxID=67297 RepID=UPI003442DFC4